MKSLDAFGAIADGKFEEGISLLAKCSAWQDERLDLDGPFDLAFPDTPGWGEHLLAASLLKRTAVAANGTIPVLESGATSIILQQDASFEVHPSGAHPAYRPPLAILRAALIGNLLDKPFIPLGTGQSDTQTDRGRGKRVGITWASVSDSQSIGLKSIPLEELLAVMNPLGAELISLQRKPELVPPNARALMDGIEIVEESVVSCTPVEKVVELVKVIQQLDYLVTVSTTTTHIAAALGVRVELLVAQREGQQWFWEVQAKHGKCFYPSVRVHMGGTGAKWWASALHSLSKALSE